MAIDFPNSPTAGDLYTAGGKTWQWNSTYWSAYGTSPVLRASDSPPASPNANDLWYETDTGRLFAYVGTAWVEVGNAVDIAGALQPGQVTALSAVTTLTSDDVFPVVDNPASATASNKITYGNLVTNILASPVLTGTPTAPTASAGTNTTQVATMASKPWNTSWGVVAYTTSLSNTVTSNIVSGITTTFTANSNRRYKITAHLSTAVQSGRHIITTSTTSLGAQRVQDLSEVGYPHAEGSLIVTGNATSQTVSVSINTVAGTMNLAADSAPNIHFLLIEDIGPA
jgi:hypothetical protein